LQICASGGYNKVPHSTPMPVSDIIIHLELQQQ